MSDHDDILVRYIVETERGPEAITADRVAPYALARMTLALERIRDTFEGGTTPPSVVDER